MPSGLSGCCRELLSGDSLTPKPSRKKAKMQKREQKSLKTKLVVESLHRS